MDNRIFTKETSDKIYQILQNYCGERGDSEGSVETLQRICEERDKLIKLLLKEIL